MNLECGPDQASLFLSLYILKFYVFFRTRSQLFNIQTNFNKMNVIKNKVISLKICKKNPEDDPPSPNNKKNYKRRFSLPYGKIVDSWKKENMVVTPCREEEEYPIYQSASFRRFVCFCTFQP